ncbi:MAG: hypothetical protein AB8B51_09750 [Sedimentitalea sp.]
MAPYEFRRQGRSLRAGLILAAIYLVLLAGFVWLQAAPWLVAVLAVCTVPALWDMISNPSAGLSLSETGMEWHTGRRSATLDWHELDHIRLDTKWDFSVRASAVLKTEKRLRLPQESLPAHKVFEAKLVERNISVQRHHFTGR